MDWHGYRVLTKWHPTGKTINTNPSLHIGPLPGRKGIALYLESLPEIEILAYFKSEDAAGKALAFMDTMMGGN